VSGQEGWGRKQAELGPVLWAFVGWKVAGILFNVGLLLVSLLLVMPAVAKVGAAEATSDMSFDMVLLTGEIAGTVVGLALILKRHPRMRGFWIVFLGLSVAFMLLDLLFGSGEGVVFFFVATTLAWLLYWVTAKKPRELRLSRMWSGQ
jgi:hypothetical protein